MTRRARRRSLCGAALVVVAVLAVTLIVAGCGGGGGDKWVGTYKALGSNSGRQLQITKVSTGTYQLSDASGQGTAKLTAVEEGGALHIKDPSGKSKQEIVISRHEGGLTMTFGSQTTALEKVK